MQSWPVWRGVGEAGQVCYTGPMTIAELAPKDQGLVIRASAHAAAEAMLLPGSRFQEGVTDLEVARVLSALERGALIVPSASRPNRWMLGVGTPNPLVGMESNAGPRPLSRIVAEMIRLGLAYPRTERTGPASYRTYLEPAMVHLRGPVWRLPMCGGPSSTIKRYRLVDDLTLVDCQSCADAACVLITT